MALKSSIGGLVLNCDMSVSAFLQGGAIINVMALVAGYHNVNDFIKGECMHYYDHKFLIDL